MSQYTRKTRATDRGSARIPRLSARGRATVRHGLTWFLIAAMLLTTLAGPSAQNARALPRPDDSASIPPGGARAYAAIPPSAPSVYPSLAAPDEPVEVDRDRFSVTTANPDGTRTARYSVRPVSYMENGRWMAFSDTLRTSDAANAAYENARGPFRVRFAPLARVLAGEPMVTFSARGASVGVTPVGAKPTSVSSSGSTVTLADAYPATDINLTVDGERLKEDIVLKSEAAASRLLVAFELSVSGATAKKRADGSVAFVGEGGDVLFAMPAPFMTDSSGDPETGFSNAVDVSLADLGGGKLRLTYEPDLGFLRAPATRYPVTLDPTLTTWAGWLQPDGGSSQDVHILECCPTSNQNGNSRLYTGKNAAGERRDTLIRFPDLDRIPAESVVTSASLSLHADASSTAGMPIRVHRIESYPDGSAWEASTVTWGTRPPVDENKTWASFSATVPGLNRIDLSGLVRNWVRGEFPNRGVRLTSAGAAGESVQFYPSHSTEPTVRPRLDVTYYPAARYGVNKLWTYTSQDHGGGTVSRVNTSTGNAVVTHATSSIPALGYRVDLAHTYNSQDSFYRGKWDGAHYGEGWTFSQDVRLYEVDGGNAVILKDGSSADRVYLSDGQASGTRTYTAPLHYGLKLTKDMGAASGSDAVWTLQAERGATRHLFDAAGRRTRVEDRNRNNLWFTYDASGRLTGIRDEAGRDAVLEYLGPGTPKLLSKITDMAGRVHTYGYDADLNLTEVRHAAGTADETVTRFGYDDANQLVSVTNPRNHTSRIRYRTEIGWEGGTADGWTGQSNTTVSHSTAQHHEGAGSLELDFTGATFGSPGFAGRTYSTPVSWAATHQELVAWVYVPAGAPQLAGMLRLDYHPLNILTSFGPPTDLVAGRWNAVRMPNANLGPAWPVTRIGIDVRPKEGTGATYDGSVWLDDVFAKGTVREVTDAKGAANVLSRYAYDWAKRETTVSRPDETGSFANTGYTFRHGRSGQVSTVVDPAGEETKGVHDGFLRLAESSMPGGVGSFKYGYFSDASNFVKTAENEGGEQSRQGVDLANGDTLYTLDPLNNARPAGADFEATVFDYETGDTGNVTRASYKRFPSGTNLDTDRSGGTTLRSASFTYTRVNDAGGNRIAGGSIASMTPPQCVAEGRTACRTTFGYANPRLGYLTSISAPAGTGESTRRVTSISYNADGTVGETTDPKGQRSVFLYDGLGRRIGVDYRKSGGALDYSVRWTLDANGNMRAMSDDTGSTTWTYDENNRVLTESRTQNGATKTTTYEYYGNGLLKETTTFDGQTVVYHYDNFLRLSSQTDPNDPNASKAIAYGYDARSRLRTTTFPSGVVQSIDSFDPSERVKQLSLKKADGTVLQSFLYDYGLTRNADGSVSRSAAYDKGNVLKVTEKTSGLLDSTVTFGYDEYSRLVEAVRTGQNPYSQAYAYDLDNNRTSITKGGTTTTAAYDDAQQLVSETTGSAATSYGYDRSGNLDSFGPSGTPNANTLAYDAANQWESGTVSGSVLGFGYDGLGRRTAKTDDGVRQDYWYDQSGLVKETGGDDVTYLRSPGGRLLSRWYSPTHLNYGTDRLGSVTALTSASGGGLEGSYRYDPWGVGIGVTGSRYNPMRFTGSYVDFGTPYYQMGARYYQPTTGRFTQQDPLGSSIFEANRYHYAGCNLACARSRIVRGRASSATAHGGPATSGCDWWRRESDGRAVEASGGRS